MSWLDLTENLVFGGVAWIVGRLYGPKLEAALLRLQDSLGRSPVHRISLARDQKREEELLRQSWNLYDRLQPEPLRTPWRHVLDWIREDVLQEDTEEIWLIHRRLAQEVTGVLYASWDQDSDRCMVWGLVAEPRLGGEEQLAVMHRLWERLRSEVEKANARGNRASGRTEYLIEMACRSEPDARTDARAAEAALVRFLREHLEARLIQAVLVDPGSATQPNTEPSVVFAYLGRRDKWDREELLYAIYDEGLVWAFEYPDDIPGAAELAAWGQHVGKIKEYLRASLPDQVPLVSLTDPRAQAVLQGCSDRRLTTLRTARAASRPGPGL